METKFRKQIDRIAIEVQDDMQMWWVAWTIYQEYAEAILYKYLKEITQDVLPN